jgi:hypothetical protein
VRSYENFTYSKNFLLCHLDSLEILKVWHLRVVPRLEVLLVIRKSFIIEQTSWGHGKKGLQECLYININCCGISYPLSPPPTSEAVKTPGTTVEDHHDTEAADEEHIQMEYTKPLFYAS